MFEVPDRGPPPVPLYVPAGLHRGPVACCGFNLNGAAAPTPLVSGNASTNIRPNTSVNTAAWMIGRGREVNGNNGVVNTVSELNGNENESKGDRERAEAAAYRARWIAGQQNPGRNID